MLSKDKFLKLLQKCQTNEIYNSFLKTYPKIESYKNIICMISGGFDSDIMIDILTKIDTDKKIKYIFINTGLEYSATRNHIKYLEKKYGVEIETIRPKKPIPLACQEYGIPFFSKYISEMMYRLQLHNFDFANDGNLSFEKLMDKYPNCETALMWWCNKNGEKSHYNINNNKLLKEFIIENPPDFKISQKCCYYAKKQPAQEYKKEFHCDLDILGTRQQENGIRATQYKNCFSKNEESWDNYRIIFFYNDIDKQEYKNTFNIKSSDCYEIWGMKRTGCVECPFNSDFEEELNIAKTYESNMYKAMIHIFGKSYEYKKKYLEYKQKNKVKQTEKEECFKQLSFFDLNIEEH